MKNYIFLILVCFTAAFGCGNDSSQKNENTASPNAAGVENVNGNLPDTSNAVTLEQPPRNDSSKLKDSLNH